MKDQITIKLPPRELRRSIGIGVMVLVFTAMIFTIANLWSVNQSLEDQVTTLKRGGTGTTAQQSAAPTANSQTIVDTANGVIPNVSSDDRVQGNRSAKVFLVEYSDLECPFCKRFHDESLTAIQQKYGDSLGYVWREFPLNIHPNANMEAQVAECVGKVEGDKGFFTFVDKVFATTQSTGVSFDEAGTLQIAKDLGYSIDAITTCYKNGEFKNRITQHIADGTKAGVTGTPTAFIVRASDGKTKMISGAVPAANFEQAIDDLLNS
jgi:protein-disulfide isomerase